MLFRQDRESTSPQLPPGARPSGEPNSGSDDTRRMLTWVIEADDVAGRVLACTLYARSEHHADPIYIHAKIAIVDDEWLNAPARRTSTTIHCSTTPR